MRWWLFDCQRTDEECRSGGGRKAIIKFGFWTGSLETSFMELSLQEMDGSLIPSPGIPGEG